MISGKGQHSRQFETKRLTSFQTRVRRRRTGTAHLTAPQSRFEIRRPKARVQAELAPKRGAPPLDRPVVQFLGEFALIILTVQTESCDDEERAAV